MKKQLLLTTICFFIINCFTPIFSQDCEIIKDEVDDFTKQRITQTQHQVLAYKNLQSNVLRVEGNKIDSQEFISFYIVLQSIFSIDEGENILLLDESGDVTSFTINKHTIAKWNNINAWYSKFTIPITSDIKEKLLSSNYTKARIQTTEGYFEFEIKKKRRDAIRNVLKCL